MKKKSIFLCLFLKPLLSLFAETEVEALQKELRQTELEIMKREVTSENYMKYEWGRYTDEIQKAEKLEVKAAELQKKIDDLKHEKVEK